MTYTAKQIIEIAGDKTLSIGCITAKQIIEIAGDKTLSIGCILEFREDELNKKHGPVFLYKYVRQGSSSSEGYDGGKLNKGDMCFSNHRTGEFKIIGLRHRNSLYRKPDEEGEYICDKLVDKYLKILGHPIHFGHIMRLNKESQNSLARGLFDKILNRFNNNLHLYSQDCLLWDEETNQLILDYLLTVKGNYLKTH